MNRRQADRPEPVTPLPATVFVGLIVALGFVGNFDVADEYDREAEAKVIRPQIAKQDPWDAPRCPKQNAAGDFLDKQIAHNPDGMGWRFECRHQEAAL